MKSTLSTRVRPRRSPGRTTPLLRVVIIATLCCVASHAAGQNLVIWNKLGSLAEVQTSEVGHDGTILGSHFGFEPAMHGNGYIRYAIYEYLWFAPAAMTGLADAGTIELWITSKVPAPVPYQYGIFGLIGTPYGAWWGAPDCDVMLAWGDLVTGVGFNGWIGFGDANVSTPGEPTQFYATPGVPFHVALVWDVHGIAGTSETVRVYRDGAVVGSATGTWDADVTPSRPLILGYGPDNAGYDKFSVDNLKIWDAAVTDFSHRFEEDYPDPTMAEGQTWSGIKALYR